MPNRHPCAFCGSMGWTVPFFRARTGEKVWACSPGCPPMPPTFGVEDGSVAP